MHKIQFLGLQKKLIILKFKYQNIYKFCDNSTCDKTIEYIFDILT